MTREKVRVLEIRRNVSVIVVIIEVISDGTDVGLSAIEVDLNSINVFVLDDLLALLELSERAEKGREEGRANEIELVEGKDLNGRGDGRVLEEMLSDEID